MATQYKTPGVYIQEPDSFPPSIVGVDTAVPCFIGYTRVARDDDGRDLTFTPRGISSMPEFIACYGDAYRPRFYLAAMDASGTPPDRGDRDCGTVTLDGDRSYVLRQAGSARFFLHDSMRLFFANGGGRCYVISCGTYGADPVPSVSAGAIEDAIAVCKAFVGPTMVAVPDAMLLEQADFNTVTAATIAACAMTGDRIALLDVWGADRLGPDDDWTPRVAEFRAAIRSQTRPEARRHAVAYFPPIVSSIVTADDIDVTSLSTEPARLAVLTDAIAAILTERHPASLPRGAGAPPLSGTDAQLLAAVDRLAAVADGTDRAAITQVTRLLVAGVPGFAQMVSAIAATRAVVPTCGAIAGVWTANDAGHGVWAAPANIGIAMMVAPFLPIDDDAQQDLTMPADGLAINTIRSFPGRGSVIWGARTLDGVSDDWRYIQVRRTIMYVEQSVKQALETMVFRPNTAKTWVTVTAMIDGFLHGLWAAGGLTGATPAEAYAVQAGIGSTMTPDDVLNGVMRVEIGLTMIHRGESMRMTFKQQMLGGN